MTKKSYVAENGITLGLAGLALLVIFAIALPRWVHSSDTRAINLPAQLSGGYSQVTDATVQQALQGADTSASDALGSSARSALYAQGTDPSTAFFAVVARIDGGALLPSQPSRATYTKDGDVVCYAVTQSSGQLSTCRRTSSELTVQVTSPDEKTAVKYINELWTKVS